MYSNMQWFNKPDKWSFEGNRLSLFVTPKTDFWRITHYGFTVDDGPFFYETVGGEFEVKVKISGDYQHRYDQMGLMIRVNEKTWIKTGVEFVDDKINISAVVTHEKSDWSVIALSHKPDALWVKAVRHPDAVEIFYSYDDITYTMMRLAYFPEHTPVMVGMTAASPDGTGFNALFEAFQLTHKPDTRRLQWLKQNQ
jgi:regulation of enolase protein 1 (concanavalin A-like superfamily)